MNVLAKNRWLWVVALWGVAVCVAFWNHQKIDFILSVQGQTQSLSQELMFQQQNSRRLDRIQQEYSKLFLPVESLQLGVLAVRGAFSELASLRDLTLDRMTIAPIQKDAETVALDVSVSGSFERIMLFLSSVSSYRYLQDRQVVIKVDSKSGEASCELAMLLRCRVKAKSDEPKLAEPLVRSSL